MADEGIVSTAPIDDTPAPAPVAKPADGGATPATPADSAPAPQDGDTPPEAKTGDTPEKKQETPRWLQKQIDKATKRFYEQKARADLLAEENARLRPKPAVTEGAPTLEQFNFDTAAHGEATAKFYREQAARELAQNQRQAQNGQAVARILSNWEKAADKGGEKYADFDAVVGDLQPVNDLTAAIMECENAQDVAYYLGTNKEEAMRIAQMDARSQIRAIGKLEAKLMATPPEAKTPSAVPAPIKPVGGGSSPSTKKLSELTQDEFDKRRRQYLASRR